MKNELIGKRVRVNFYNFPHKTENTKDGVIINALSKEETKEIGMWGQLIEVSLDDGGIIEINHGYELLEESSLNYDDNENTLS